VESAPEDHPLPTYAHGQDAARDLYAVAGHAIRPGHTVVVPVGVALQDGMSSGWVGLVCSRSGLAARHSVHVLNAPGVIDPGYIGELQVILHNSGHSTYRVQPGERVAQFLTVPAVTGQADSTTRGQDGLGSTGSVQETPAPAAPQADPVSRPAHYTDHPVYRGQAWDYTRRLSFGRGNAFKYAWRHAGKGVPLQDLRKAEWYLENTSAQDWWSSAMSTSEVDAERTHQATLRSQFLAFHRSMVSVSPVVARYWDPRSQSPAQRPLASLRRASSGIVRLLAAMEAYQACYHILSPTGGTGLALECVRRAIHLMEITAPEDRVAPGALAP
jgi:dUTP pyrophosphatase